MRTAMTRMKKKLSALLGLPACIDRLHRGVHVLEFTEKHKESASSQQRSHTRSDGREHDAAGHRLESAHDTDNGLEAVAADMGDCRQINDQVKRAVICRAIHQFMQFASHFLVDVSVRTKDGNGSVTFYGYRHGDVVSLARDDCRCALMKVHPNSI